MMNPVKTIPSGIEIRQIPFSTEDYQKSLQVRDVVLRKPLGMSIHNDNLEADKHSIHLGAFREKEMVGTIVLTPLPEGEMKMRQVAVLETERGKNIGAGMVREAEAIALSSGCSKMVLHARKVVREFYEKLGYHTVGSEFTEVGIPHFRMEKSLA
jgi:predicted GNAT family N-acyltransferase